MKKRYLRKFLNIDDSFLGQYFHGKTVGLDFDIVTSLKTCKKDNIPRLHVITYNNENLAKLPTTRSYLLLGPGKIKRITLYHKDFNEERERILKIFSQVYYKEITNYFFGKDDTDLNPDKIRDLI